MVLINGHGVVRSAGNLLDDRQREGGHLLGLGVLLYPDCHLGEEK